MLSCEAHGSHLLDCAVVKRVDFEMLTDDSGEANSILGVIRDSLEAERTGAVSHGESNVPDGLASMYIL